jgi:hypothetical protein
MKCIDTSQGQINFRFVVSLRSEKISDDKKLPVHDRYRQIVTYLEGRNILTAYALRPFNVEDVFETTIIPAQSGFSVIELYEIDDPPEIIMDLYPVIGWKVTESYDVPMLRPLIYHVDDSAGDSASWPVLYPDGRVVVPMETIFPTIEEYRAHAIKEMAEKKERAEAKKSRSAVVAESAITPSGVTSSGKDSVRQPAKSSRPRDLRAPPLMDTAESGTAEVCRFNERESHCSWPHCPNLTGNPTDCPLKWPKAEKETGNAKNQTPQAPNAPDTSVKSTA